MGLLIIINDLRNRKSNKSSTRRLGLSYWWSIKYKVGITKYPWAIRRASGILLIFIVLYHVIRIHLLLGEAYYLSWYSVVKLGYGSLKSLLLYLVFVFVLSFHSSDGFRVLLIDFLGIESDKKLTLFSLLVGLIFFVIASGIAIKLYFMSNQI